MACWSGPIDGGKACVVPLIAMVATGCGRSWRTTLRIASPVRAWTSRDTASTMVRCAAIASRRLANSGLARGSVLDVPKEASTWHRSW